MGFGDEIKDWFTRQQEEFNTLGWWEWSKKQAHQYLPENVYDELAKEKRELEGAIKDSQDGAANLIITIQNKAAEAVTNINTWATETWHQVTETAEQKLEEAKETFQAALNDAKDTFDDLTKQQSVADVPVAATNMETLMGALRQYVDKVADDPRSQDPLFADYVAQLHAQMGDKCWDMPVEDVNPTLMWNLRWVQGQHLVSSLESNGAYNFEKDHHMTLRELATLAQSDPKLRAYLNQQLAAQWKGDMDAAVAFTSGKYEALTALSGTEMAATDIAADITLSANAPAAPAASPQLGG